MGLFARTAAKQQGETKQAKKKATVWLCGTDPNSEAVGKAVKELIRLKAEQKAVAAKMDVFKSTVKKHADENYIRDYANSGMSPETPMVVQNADGDQVTYVVQDRSGQYGVKPEQQEALVGLLGEDKARELLFEETSFSLNRDVLAIPGVMEVVEKALEGAIDKLTSAKGGKQPILAQETADALLTVNTKTAFRPGTMDRIADLCGKDTQRMREFANIAGSSLVRYVLP